MLTVNKRVKLV